MPQDAMYPGDQVPRGSSMFFTKVARTPGQRFRTFSCQAGLWLRVDSWLNAVAKTGVKVGHATCQQVALQLEFGDSEPDMASTLREELVGCLTSGETFSRNREEVFRGFAKQAQQEHLAEDSQNYQSWLEGAMVKGMRPLYKAIRSQEMVLVRPFRDKEAALRPYLRYFQWAQIWGSQEEPTEAILPDLQQRAIEEAKGLEPISTLVGLKKGCHTQKSCYAVGFGLGFGFAFRLGRDLVGPRNLKTWGINRKLFRCPQAPPCRAPLPAPSPPSSHQAI